MKNNTGNNIKNSNLNRKTSIEKYKKRQLDFRSESRGTFLNKQNVCILLIIFLSFIYIGIRKFDTGSIYVTIFIYILLMIYLLVIDKFREKQKIAQEIEIIKNKAKKEHTVFLDKIKEMEEIEKNQLKNIILKDSDDYDIKIWEIGRASTLVLGKNTARNRVDIDIAEGLYSNLVSRVHGVLNRVNGVWYYEDLGSQNGSGLEKRSDKRKIKIEKNKPIRVQTGDIIYLAKTKILLK